MAGRRYRCTAWNRYREHYNPNIGKIRTTDLDMRDRGPPTPSTNGTNATNSIEPLQVN